MSNLAVSQNDSDSDLMSRMRHRLQSLAYASRLYRLMISGPVPRALEAIPADPWPGEGAQGEAIVEGFFSAAGQRFSAHPPLWLPDGANLAWLFYVHGFEWLRDLRALGGDTARRVARSLTASWLDRFEHWAPFVWEPQLVALRLTHLIALHDFMLASADTSFRARVFECLVRHHKHLLRLTPGAVAGFSAPLDEEGQNNVHLPLAAKLQGAELLVVLRGLLYAGVALPEGDKALKLGLEMLPIALRHAVLADGANAERNPARQIDTLKCLVDLRHALRIGKLPLPPELPIAIERAAMALRFFRHGDGALSLFNGAQEENPVLMDALLTQADARGRAPKSLIHGGYERLTLGRMLALVDVGAPPPPGLDSEAHAGLGSFELSIGRERLFVNCGTHPGHDNDAWYSALAATAAHSAVVIDDKNSCEILEKGGVGSRPLRLELSRKDTKESQQVNLTHDGYLAEHGLLHQRVLTLQEGEMLRGEDSLRGSVGKAIALRFHLHPLVQISLIQNDRAALLKLQGGTGFRFRCENPYGEGMQLHLEESLYFGKTLGRKTRQIVIKATSLEGDTRFLWNLTREGKTGK